MLDILFEVFYSKHSLEAFYPKHSPRNPPSCHAYLTLESSLNRFPARMDHLRCRRALLPAVPAVAVQTEQKQAREHHEEVEIQIDVANR